MIAEACTCAVTKSGTSAGCHSIEIVDTDLGPRIVEGECQPRGDGSFAAAAQDRADRAAKAARVDAAPEGAMVAATVGRAGLSADGGSWTREGSTLDHSGGAFRRR